MRPPALVRFGKRRAAPRPPPTSLPFYAILRSIPDKTLGILAMGGSLLLLALLPLEGGLRRWGGLRPGRWVNLHFAEGPLSHRSSARVTMALVNLLGAVFLLLGFVGSRPVAEPYVSVGLGLTLAYFGLLLLLPLGGLASVTLAPAGPAVSLQRLRQRLRRLPTSLWLW